MAKIAWSVGLARGSATGLAACALAFGAGLGCGDDTIGPNPSNDAGSSADATTSDADAGPPDSGTTTTLYQRLGGHAGIRNAVNAIVAAELMNQDIASYFFFQSGAPGNGHPTADQIEECFTDLVGSAAMGPETYPTTITTDAGAYTCRSMQAIHAPLLISGGTFDTFVMIAGSTLASAGVSSDDVATLASVLDSTKPAIVTSSLADAGLEPYPGNDAAGTGGGSDSGTATDAGADAATTLYQRLGGHAGIRNAVNAIVGAELQNQDIASYFFFQSGAPGNGHPTADQIEECFTDLVGSAAMGPETYPTTITTDAGAYTCRSMQAIHAPLLISGGTFDTFVMIAGSTLTSAGVSSADVTTLASVLNGAKTDIVTGSLADAGLEPYPGNDAGDQ
ncbi:MAG TPA: hypothetical protein VK841_03295 [Polyangiaceae bacterium]|nr:hypothetical protein [Polyangiaceae bacterium]